MAPSISKAAFVVSDILVNISLSRPVDSLKPVHLLEASTESPWGGGGGKGEGGAVLR